MNSERCTYTKELPVNERIRARDVRLIGDAGEQLGVLSFYDALNRAREQGLDLVAVAPQAVPPVCKIMDYGKYKYEQTKKERDQHRNQKISIMKEIRLHPKTDTHDINFRVRNIETFLGEGHKVKVSVVFKGREITHPEIGRTMLEGILTDLQGIAAVERPPLLEGRSMSMILTRGAPAPADKRAKPPEGKDAAPAATGSPSGSVS